LSYNNLSFVDTGAAGLPGKTKSWTGPLRVWKICWCHNFRAVGKKSV